MSRPTTPAAACRPVLAFVYRYTAEKERQFESAARPAASGVRLPVYGGKGTPVHRTGLGSVDPAFLRNTCRSSGTPVPAATTFEPTSVHQSRTFATDARRSAWTGGPGR
jgi:hypothetical protein